MSLTLSRGAIVAVFACLAALVAVVAPTDAAKKKNRKPVLIHVKAPETARGGIPLALRPTRPLKRVTVAVNGRRVGARVGRRKRQLTRLPLGATARVRFGRNTIVIRAVDRRGRRQVVRRSIRVRRGTPLAGIRLPRRAVQGRSVRLDGRPSRTSRNGRLRYRWRVVQRPSRASTTLRGARGARPRLSVSHPGRYALALTLVEGSREARASAGACAVRAASQPKPAPKLPKAAPTGPPAASAPMHLLAAPGQLETIRPTSKPRPPARPPARKAARGCVTEVVHVDVQPNVSPLGAMFDARHQQDGKTGIRVGTTFYATQAGRASLLVLDALTLEGLSFSTAPTGMPLFPWLALQWLPYQLSGREVLVVLTGMPGCCQGDWKYPNNGFTVVQTPAQDASTTTQNLGLTTADGEPAGDMTGYLQQTVPLDGATPKYRFVSPERVAFDTSAQSSPRTNTMAIGDKTYAGELPANASAGFQVLVTDSALRPQGGGAQVFGTNMDTPAGSQQQEQAMANVLSQAAKQPGVTVFVQSIGHPRPASPAAPSVALALEQLGGTMWMAMGLDGSGGYALVGNPPPAGEGDDLVAAAETSSQWQGGGNGDLQGVLRRRGDQALYAPLADATGTPDYGLAQVVYQAPTAWPETDTPGKVAATRYAAEQLGLFPGPGSCYQPAQPDFRSSYCNVNLAIDNVLVGLDGLTYPSGASFTQEEFAAVVKQLKTEVGYVAEVRTLIANLETPFGTQNPAVDSSAIGGKIIKAIPPPKESAVSGDLELAASVLYVGAEVPEVGEVLGPIASVLDLASVLTEDGGEPSPDWDIQTAAGAMGQTVENRLQTTTGNLNRFQDILVSDYGKLESTARNAVSAWGVTADGINDQKSTLSHGIEQWLWTGILPSAYDLVAIWGVPLNQPSQAWCVYSRAPEEWRPWAKADVRTTFFPLDGWSGGRPTAGRMMGMLSGSFSNRNSKAAGSDLADEMFRSPDAGGAGLVAPWLYERAKWDVQAPKLVQPTSPLVPGYCGVGSE